MTEGRHVSLALDMARLQALGHTWGHVRSCNGATNHAATAWAKTACIWIIRDHLKVFLLRNFLELSYLLGLDVLLGLIRVFVSLGAWCHSCKDLMGSVLLFLPSTHWCLQLLLRWMVLLKIPALTSISNLIHVQAWTVIGKFIITDSTLWLSGLNMFFYVCLL